MTGVAADRSRGSAHRSRRRIEPCCGGRGRFVPHRSRRDIRPGRQIRLRQEHHGARLDRPVASAAVDRRRRHPIRGPRDPAACCGRATRAARQSHRHDLPGADDGAQSGLAGRPADRGDVRAAQGQELAGSRPAGRRGAGERPRSRARATGEGLPAPALRRHAPTRDDRHRARLRAGSPDRRRADHRARRHRAGGDHRADAESMRRARAPPS